MKGTIKKLVKEKKFGFIATKGSPDLFFHQSALQNVKFDDLTEGQEVEFEPGEGEKGPRAEDVYA